LPVPVIVLIAPLAYLSYLIIASIAFIVANIASIVSKGMMGWVTLGWPGGEARLEPTNSTGLSAT
jgi:hypothetical protein